jgi:hypothetical protein
MLAVSALLKIVMSPGGKLLAGVVALALWTAYQRNDATNDCRDEQLRVELQAANESLKKAANVAREAEQNAAEAIADLEELKGEKDALLAELDKQGASCVLSDDVRERLLRIK